jgi:hypothetical protein
VNKNVKDNIFLQNQKLDRIRIYRLDKLKKKLLKGE